MQRLVVVHSLTACRSLERPHSWTRQNKCDHSPDLNRGTSFDYWRVIDQLDPESLFWARRSGFPQKRRTRSINHARWSHLDTVAADWLQQDEARDDLSLAFAPDPPSELTSDPMRSLQQHHRSVFERPAPECWASHNKLQRHCLKLKKEKGVCGANTLINSSRHDHQSIQATSLSDSRFTIFPRVANLPVALGGLVQTSFHSVKQKLWIGAGNGSLRSQCRFNQNRTKNQSRGSARETNNGTFPSVRTGLGYFWGTHGTFCGANLH